MSILKEVNEAIKRTIRDVNILKNKVNDDSNLYFSQAQVVSVSEDRTHCDILILDKLTSLKNVLVTIPCNELNLYGHVTTEDIVLVAYNFGFTNPFIMKKISTSLITADINFKLNNRLDLSTLTI
jgi:hypothetical protein